VLRDGGYVLRELESGSGYVDISILLSRVLHLVEMKILRGRLDGVEQLAVYMKQEARPEGWLIAIDARPPNRKTPVAPEIRTSSGIVRVLTVEINPTPPSRQRRRQ
jgi:hypothetical protein